MTKQDERTVKESIVETIHLIRPNHLNSAGRLFGGILMQWIDEIAGLVAKRHARIDVTTVSVDDLHFIRGAYLGDVVVLTGKITYVGHTSMEIKVRTSVESLEGEHTLINEAYFTMVALDEKGNPVTVPKLRLETVEERQNWEGAKKRREIRVMRQKEGF